MSKKGKKKGCKYSLNRIVLATAIINLLIEIIELIQSISIKRVGRGTSPR